MPAGHNDSEWLIYTHSGEDESYEGYEAWIEQQELIEESESELAQLAEYYRHERTSEEECE
jgi:hypothetical protein